VVCATPDLLQDASFNVEQWVMRKAERALVFRTGGGKHHLSRSRATPACCE
jgi:hypothetical protein